MESQLIAFSSPIPTYYVGYSGQLTFPPGGPGESVVIPHWHQREGDPEKNFVAYYAVSYFVSASYMSLIVQDYLRNPAVNLGSNLTAGAALIIPSGDDLRLVVDSSGTGTANYWVAAFYRKPMNR